MAKESHLSTISTKHNRAAAALTEIRDLPQTSMYWAQKTCSTLDGLFVVLRPRPQHNKEILDREH